MGKNINKIIVGEFEKLINQIGFDIDHGKDRKERIQNMFRLKQIEKALVKLKEMKDEIKGIEQLEGISGIGSGIKRRIKEILETGKLAEITYDTKDIDYKEYIDNLLEVYGIGEKTAYELVTKNNIHTVDELIKAYEDGKVDLNHNVLMGLKYYKKYEQKIPRKEMIRIDKYLRKMIKEINVNMDIIVCGSYRRNRPFSNDIDCMITHKKIVKISDLKNGQKYLLKLVGSLKDDGFIIDSLTGDDVETKYMGFCRLTTKTPIRRIDIRLIPKESYSTALLYFTGSGNFNKDMRQHAKKLGYKLSEYGLYKIISKGKYKKIDVKSEEDIFDKLNMTYVEPEDRK